MASNVSNLAKTNTSALGDKVREILQNPASSASQAAVYNMIDTTYDMDEYYDMLMDLAGYNNNWSAGQAAINRQFQADQAQKAMNFEASQADKQMAYQTRSDQAAMAWSAQEAAKEREWSKNLSDTAHRREVKDLIAAGLNPILSANSGAWAGSGSSGQGYSSSGAMGAGHSGSGAMGQTDMGVTGTIGALMSNSISTARDMAITRIQTDQSKYNTDMQFAIAKLQAETSIYNNNNNIDANKAINALNRDSDIRKASISADATKQAAAMSAGAITSAAATQAAAARYSADQHLEATKETAGASRYSANRSYQSTQYRADKDYDIQKLKNETNMVTNPAGYLDYMQNTRFGQYLDQTAGLIDDIVGNRSNPEWWPY